MLKRLHRLRHVFQLASTLLTLIVNALRYLGLCLHPSSALAAENLFLRKHWRCIKSAMSSRGV